MIILGRSFRYLKKKMFRAYLAPVDDIMAPVVGGAAVAPFTNGVRRTDTLSCVGVTVIPHVTALTS